MGLPVYTYVEISFNRKLVFLCYFSFERLVRIIFKFSLLNLFWQGKFSFESRYSIFPETGPKNSIRRNSGCLPS